MTASLSDSLSLWRTLVQASVRSQMQHKISFIMLSVGNFGAVSADLVALWALYARFGNLPNWTLPQIALLYGMVQLAFAIAECVGRGFDQFSGVIRTGEFDRFLVRPRSAALLLAGQIFELSRIGRLFSGLIALLWGGLYSGVAWSFAKVILVTWATLGGAATFLGVLVLQATLCFWTVESLEMVNAVTYGGITAAQMPLTIYPKWLRYLFTFGVPIACMNYLPADVLLDRSSYPLLAWLAPLVGFFFLAISLPIFNAGVRKYTSAGG
ncbi:MAG: ABC-2 family transporter protein [Armatimonas sp.]